jgi:CheY-like chemotaxis protein
VPVVYHPETALQAARSQIPDIVLLDIGLPSMDGYELAGRLRAIAEGKPMVVIAITGYGLDHDRSKQGSSQLAVFAAIATLKSSATRWVVLDSSGHTN